jgi:epsilon-lactone hydrolase
MKTNSNIPNTISPEARKILQNLIEEFDPDLKYPAPNDFAQWEQIQAEVEELKTEMNENIAKGFEVTLVEKEIDDLKFLEIYPKKYQKSEKVIIYLHGGGFTFYSAKTTLAGSVPVADQSGIKVIALDYPLAPGADYQVILQHFTDLYDYLLKSGHASENIAVYGESAGGNLAAGGLLKLKDEGFPMPASVVLWSPWSDLSGVGDSYISLTDHDPKLHFKNRLVSCALAYAPAEAHQTPYVSPVYGNYDSLFPPTLIQVGTREIFLSDAVRLFQKMDEQDMEVTLDVYEGMWHAWQKEYTMPEAKRAILKTCNFFERHWK